jgi:hypothetical protein
LREAVAARGITLTPTRRPSEIGRWLRIGALVLVLLVLAPLLIVAAPFLIWMLRRREKRDPVVAPRPTPERVVHLSHYEDRDVTNPFGAMGSLKPGQFRLRLAQALLFLVNFAARNISVHGKLGRVRTIHAARWILIEGGRRSYFASDYDGSHEAYMDDFVNKVAFGLNLSFSHAVGYPRTDWLVLGGARREGDYKAYLRRHEIATPVWYKAYPGLTTQDLARNSRIREGLEREGGDERSIRRWLAEI